MQSKAMFDIDSNNCPIIKVTAVATDDLRDKIARRFVEAGGHTSIWCNIYPSGNDFLIIPITPEEMRREGEAMIRAAQDYEDQLAKYSKRIESLES